MKMENENIEFLNLILQENDYKQGNLILDIGSHKAAFVNACANIFGNDINIIAFEPDCENFKNVLNETKNYKNCICVNKAIFYSSKKQTKVLGVGDRNIGGYMVSDIETEHVNNNMFPHLHEYEGKTFDLTDLESYTNEPWLAKLDCEASEWNILKNSTAIKNTKHIILEIHNHDEHYAKWFITDHLPNHKIIKNYHKHFYLKK